MTSQIGPISPDPIDLSSSTGHLAEHSRITGKSSSTRLLSDINTHSNSYRGPEIGFGGTPDDLSQIVGGEAMVDHWCSQRLDLVQ